MKKAYFNLVLMAILFAPALMFGQNLVTNPGFETWTGGTPDSWTTTNVSQESTIVKSGSYSAAITSASSYKKCLQKILVTPGNQYTISFWYFDEGTNAKAKLKASWLDSAGQQMNSLTPPEFDVDFNPNDSAWHHYSAVVTAPTGAKKVKFEVRALSEGGNTGGKIYYDDMYFGSVVPDPEPDNHVTGFHASLHGLFATLYWQDATGNNAPGGYVIIGTKGNGTPVTPVDGTPIANDLDWSDGAIAVNIPYSYQKAELPLLDSSATYDFKIYPYSNAGSVIDYKTNGTVPDTSFTTGRIVVINYEGFETGTSGSWSTENVTGAKTWIFPTFKGRTTAKIDGGTQVNEDWLISPALNLSGYDTIMFTFANMKNKTGDSLHLYISTNYSGSGDPNTATWTDITSQANWSSGSYQLAITDSLDLSSYSGQTIYIGLKYTSTAAGGALYKVDNFQVYAVLPEVTIGIENAVPNNLISIYPNPAENNFYVKAEKAGTLSVIDAVGRVVLNKDIENGTNNIDVVNLEKGVYIVNILFEDGTQSVSKLVLR